ncbi:hypothetical protein DDE01_12120 [Desulfovibrio desulfuricans]|nr:hypothetical protein DDE01_12120 [Desulfovibrio desulfuricans]
MMRPLLIAALASLCIAVPAVAGDGITITRNPDGSVTIEGGQRTAPRVETQEEMEARLRARDASIERRYESYQEREAINARAAARNHFEDKANREREERAEKQRREDYARDRRDLEDRHEYYQHKYNSAQSESERMYYKRLESRSKDEADAQRRAKP